MSQKTAHNHYNRRRDEEVTRPFLAPAESRYKAPAGALWAN